MKNNKSIMRVIDKLEQLSEKSNNTRTVNKYYSSEDGIYSTDGIRAIWIKPYSGIYTKHLTIDDSNPLHFNNFTEVPPQYELHFDINLLQKTLRSVKNFSNMIQLEYNGTSFTFTPLKPKTNGLKDFNIEIAGVYKSESETPLKIGFTCKYLIDALQVAKTAGDEYIKIKITSPIRPVVLEGFTYDLVLKQLVSPVRLSH